MENKEFEEWFEKQKRQTENTEEDYSDVFSDFIGSKEGLEMAFEAGQPRCQKVKTKYCKCNCGKHKENGDY